MNKIYCFYYKRRFWWKKIKVVGHTTQEESNKMVLYLPDGGIQEIARWSDCECKLGVDWVLATKEQIKEEAGQ